VLNPRDLLGLNKAEEREFTAMDRAMRDARAWLDDPSMLRLAHPVRLMATPATAPAITLITMAESRHHSLVRELLAKRMATIDIFKELERRGDQRLLAFYEMHTGTAELSGGFGNGAAGATAQGLRFLTCGGRVFTFTDELVQALHETNLGSDIPVSELKLPLPNIFIELGSDREASPFALHNAESGRHALEGAYVSSVVDADGNDCLEVTMTGSPVGHLELMDDAIEWASMRAAGQVSISQSLIDAYTKPASTEDSSPYFDDQSRLLDQARASVPRLELIAKCILFLGLSDALKKEVLEGTEAKRALARAVSGAHKRRAARVLARSYDRIVVEATPDEHSAEAAGRTLSQHWRKPHMRMQRHGPGLSLTKVILIRRQFINAGVTPAS
jgi:hypothetical protein